MDPFVVRNGELYAEDVPVAAIAGDVGTPCYVYSRACMEARFAAFDQALAAQEHLVCYAVKANSNLAVLALLARRGAGFDIVSGGELERVLAAGGDPRRVVFSGVGKTIDEMRRALDAGIHCFNVESDGELELLDRLAGERGTRARCALRVNPDVDAGAHPYIATGLKENKFGIDIAQAPEWYRRARGLPHVEVVGVACHVGSQLTAVAPFLEALTRVGALVTRLADMGIELEHLDLGGGLGICYDQERPPEPLDYGRALIERLQAMGERFRRMRLLIEPGRAIVGSAGLLLTRVLYLKAAPQRNFAVVDAGMNDLLRPALYGAWHRITAARALPDRAARVYDVVGPVCESADFLGRGRELAIAPGDLLAVWSAGAYAASMGSNYNARARAPEVLVDGGRWHVVRRRESLSDLMSLEAVPPGLAGTTGA